MKKDILYLKKLFSKPFRAVKAGGQTNRNYVVTLMKPFGKLPPSPRLRRASRAGKFFARLPWEGVIDRNVEGANVVRLAQNQKLKAILPQFFLYILRQKNILDPKDKRIFSVPDGTMVSEYLAGKEFNFAMFRKKKYQQALAKMFYTFHTSGVRFVNPYNVFRDEIRKYQTAAVKYQLQEFLDETTVRQLLKIGKEAEQKLPALKRGISTHNDFLFQNFLVGKGGRLYLLDFEYAGLNKKGGIVYDFGFLFADNLFRKPSVTKELFEAFLEVVDRVYKRKLNRKQIYWSAAAALLVQVWWGILRYFSVKTNKEKKYFKEYIQKRAKGILQLHNAFKEKGARKS